MYLRGSLASSMTEVLSSKQYINDVQEMDFSPRQSPAVNVDSNELAGNSSSPFAIRSPLVSPLVDVACSARCDELLQRHSLGDWLGRGRRNLARSEREQVELSVIALLLGAFKRTGFTCKRAGDDIKMEIGWPTNVRHVTHVTFDRFNGFLGLPVEFELEIPRRVPSASASVFGVSPESMQCSYDGKGNSVPTILLLLQETLYEQGGLKAEGVFRINAENSQEEQVRDQLNKGIVPHDIDVHCLAGIIKAWFRELPQGVLDNLSPEQVMQCHTEEQCLALVSTLPPTQGALLNWAINLMADVVQEEHYNKMNARNIAMVFAPNMTQMSDPLTALMHAVQVMNLLKTLILKMIGDRQESRPASLCSEPPSENGHHSPSQEPGPGFYGVADGDENLSNVEKDGIFLKTFSERDSIEGYESAEDKFMRDSSTKENTDEDEFSTDSREQFTTGSSTMDNTDDDSNGLDSFARKRCFRGRTIISVSKLSMDRNTGRAGARADACSSSTSLSQYLASELNEKENTKVEIEKFGIKSSVQCGGLLDSPPSKGQVKGGGIVGKFDQQIERVEAW